MAEQRNVGQEIGTTGLMLANGGTVEEEIHPNLAGRQAIRVYRDMGDNDPVVGSVLYAIDMLCRQVDWHVEEGESDQEGVEHLESCIDDMNHSWADFISEILSMLRYGWSYHEIVYKIRQGRQKDDSTRHSSKHDDKKIGWARLPIRAQDTLQEWKFDPKTGRVLAFVQQGPPTYQRKVIPIQKALLFRTTTYKDSPEGRSLLRNAYRPWYFKNRIETIEGVGIERDLAGLPILRVPASYLADTARDADKAMISAMKQIGANIRRDKQEFVIWPQAYDEQGNPLFDIELMSAGGTRQFDTSAIITRYDQRIAQTVLADFILLGHDKVGSFALSSDKTDIFAVALGTVLDTIEEVLNRYAVPRLWEMNGWDPAKAPKIKHGDIEDRDLTSLATFLQTLSTIGVQLTPDDDFDKWVREVAHMPERSEEARLMQEEQREQQEQQQRDEQDGIVEDANGAISFVDGQSQQSFQQQRDGGGTRRSAGGRAGPGGPGQSQSTPAQ